MAAMSAKRPESLVALALPALAALVLAAATPATAHAKTEHVASYPFQRAWPTAVRFLRIDEGFSILERDADTGYVVFEFKQDGRMFSGSLEVVSTEDDDGRPAVRLVVHIPDRPPYIERGILDRLARKLRHDYGDPQPVPEPPEEKEPPRKGDKDKDKGKGTEDKPGEPGQDGSDKAGNPTERKEEKAPKKGSS